MLALVLWACAAPLTPVDDLGDPESSETREAGTSEGTETDSSGTDDPDSGLETDPDSGSDSAPDSGIEPDTEPESWLTEVGLYLNLGDSLAAGYDAADGGGYAWLLHQNQAGWPDYAGQDLRTLADPQVLHLAHSGDTSDEILDTVRSASLPPVNGRVVVTLSAGGNDFNDDLTTMISADATRAVAAEVRSNIGQIMAEVRSAYPGQEVSFYVLDIQDPTGGTGTIPAGYDEGFCEALRDWGWLLGPTAVGNLELLNAEIAAETRAQGETLVPYHDLFQDHGLNTSSGWMSDDCAHPTSLGHHELRRLIWSLWTGEWL